MPEYRSIFAIFLFVCWSLITVPGMANEPFYVADDMDAVPYISLGSNQKPEGIFHDIIDAVMHHIGQPYRYEVFPWRRAQKLVKNLGADALITIPTQERLQYLVASREPVFVMKYKMFTQEDNPQLEKIRNVKQLSDLKGLKILDYIGDGWAERNLRQYGVEWAPNLSAVCKKLANYRGDIFIQDEVMVLYTMQKLRRISPETSKRFNKIIAVDAPVEDVGFYLLIHKDSAHLNLLQAFDETIRKMRETGELDEIRNRWIH